MLSLVELTRAAQLLECEMAGQRLQAVVQPDATSVVLTTYGGEAGAGMRRHWLLCARPSTARVSQLERPPRSLDKPPALVQYLRAHAIGGRIRSVRILHADRQLALHVSTSEVEIELVLSLLGPRSNLYILRERCLVACLRPLAETRVELSLGQPWRSPESKPPSAGRDRFEEVEDADFLRAIEDHYAKDEQDADRSALQRRVEQVLNKQRKQLERKLGKLDRDLGSARAALVLERHGELLKGVMPNVEPRAREVIARDHETGEEVAIELDPGLSASENLSSMFKRYRKALRTLTRGGAQEDAVKSDLEAVRVELGALEELARSDDGSESVWAEFSQRPLVARCLEKFASAPRAQGSRPGGPAPDRKLGGLTVPSRLVPRRYRTAGGMEIWVGRSDTANDFLSTRLARGKDLFFHLEGAPGSHVVLRTGGRSDPPSEAVLDACELAVQFSKAKKDSRADVHMVPIRNVRKPKGAKPGLVMVHGGRCIHLRRDAKRLARVMEDRIED